MFAAIILAAIGSGHVPSLDAPNLQRLAANFLAANRPSFVFGPWLVGSCAPPRPGSGVAALVQDGIYTESRGPADCVHLTITPKGKSIARYAGWNAGNDSFAIPLGTCTLVAGSEHISYLGYEYDLVFRYRCTLSESARFLRRLSPSAEWFVNWPYNIDLQDILRDQTFSIKMGLDAGGYFLNPPIY
jgi:hypothetical protein